MGMRSLDVGEERVGHHRHLGEICVRLDVRYKEEVFEW